MNERHPLGALIAEVQETNGWSDREIEVIAAQRGHSISRSNVSRIKNHPVTSMKASQMRALSAALHLPLRVLVTAALESMDLPTFGGSEMTPEEAIQADRSVPERERTYLLTMLTEVRRSRVQVSDEAVRGDGYTVQFDGRNEQRIVGPVERTLRERSEGAPDSSSQG